MNVRRRMIALPTSVGGIASIGVSIIFVLAACFFALGPARHLGATADEGAHIGAGLQWWGAHRFSYEPLTPPFARIAVSFLPWLMGFHSQGMPGIWDEGHAVIASGDTAALLLGARIASLFFLVWASGIVWLLGLRAGGLWTAAAAVGCFVTIPPILGNASIATTDLAQAATFSTLVYAFILLIDTSSPRKVIPFPAILFGFAGALAVTTKFTSIALFPGCALCLLVCRWRVSGPLAGRQSLQAIWRAVPISAPVAFLLIWAIYNFRIGSLLWHVPASGMEVPHSGPASFWAEIAAWHVFPANEFWRGLLDGFRRNGVSPPDYLFGRLHDGGTIFFYPTEFLLRTPIPFLLLLAYGMAHSVIKTHRTSDWMLMAVWVAGCAVIAGTMMVVFHAGIRFLLASYVFFSVTAGMGIIALWEKVHRRLLTRTLVILAAIWSCASIVESRRDYLGWFNEVASSDPAWFIRSSNSGQRGVFIAEKLHELGVKNVYLMLSWDPKVQNAYYGTYHDVAELRRDGMPPFTRLPPDKFVTGWIAITVDSLDSPSYAWLKNYKPVAKESYEVFIYHILPDPKRVN